MRLVVRLRSFKSLKWITNNLQHKNNVDQCHDQTQSSTDHRKHSNIHVYTRDMKRFFFNQISHIKEYGPKEFFRKFKFAVAIFKLLLFGNA